VPVVKARPWAVRLAFAALILTGTALGDRFGRRRVFLAGFAAFTLASAACALVPSVAAVAMLGEDYAAGKFARTTDAVQAVTRKHPATLPGIRHRRSLHVLITNVSYPAGVGTGLTLSAARRVRCLRQLPLQSLPHSGMLPGVLRSAHAGAAWARPASASGSLPPRLAEGVSGLLPRRGKKLAAVRSARSPAAGSGARPAPRPR